MADFAAMSTSTELDRGCYTAKRAAALSGVPLSTVYYWARHGPVQPSVSATRERLWSYGDLIRLRTVYWLRQHRKHIEDREVTGTSMGLVREVLQTAERRGHRIWEPAEGGRVRIWLLLDERGMPYIDEGGLLDAEGQSLLLDGEELDLLGPFETDAARGPDLVRPRPRLRIVPGKCAGEPHLAGSRLQTRALMALSARGFSVSRLQELYPDDDPVGIEEAVEFERSLTPTLEPLAA